MSAETSTPQINFERIIYELLKNEPFFAHFILNSRILFDKMGVNTAAAGVLNGATTLIFNTNFLNKLPFQSQIAVLKHEILHLLFDHTDNETYEKKNAHIWNLAQDCAINQHISNLPAEGITLNSLIKITGKQLQAFQSATYYYNELLDSANALSVQRTLDDHDLIEESVEDKQISKGIIAKAAQAAQTASAGQIPQGLTSIISKLSAPPTVNWKQQLRNFTASAISSKVQGTRKRLNRRFELDAPGKRKKRELKLAVCIDTSGSVSDKQLGLFLTEIEAVSKYCAELNLIYADCEVHKIINLKQGKKPPTERYGSGGTAYQPALNKSLELGANAIIYFGDMDTADTPTNPNKPVLWVTVGSSKRPGEFGKMIELKA